MDQRTALNCYKVWAEKKLEAESALQGALFDLLDSLSEEDLRTLSHHVSHAHDELVANDVEYLRHRMAVSYLWNCVPDSANPLPNCVYNERTDPRHDWCVFCGQPAERK